MSSPTEEEHVDMASSQAMEDSTNAMSSSKDEERSSVNDYTNFLCSKNNLGVMKLALERVTFLQKARHDKITIEEALGHIKAETIMLLECMKKQTEADNNVPNTELIRIMCNRINMIYDHLFRLFPVEIQWLKEYMNFYQNFESFINVGNNLLSSLMIKKHPNYEVYVTGAVFEYETRSNIAAARKYFLYGKQFHDDQRLYLEEFCFEAKVLQNTNGLSLLIALEKYKNTIQCFKGDLQFHIQLLDKALHLTTVREFQYHVIKDMIIEYKFNTRMWQKLAKISFDGFIFDREREVLVYDKHFKRRLINSFNAFEEGLRENSENSLKKKHLWNCYTDHIILIWKTTGVTNETIEGFLNAKMKWVFENAHNYEALKDTHYVYWAEYTNQENSFALDKAISLNTNVNIWCEVLMHFLGIKIYQMAFKVLQDSMKALQAKTLPLWKNYIYMLEKNKERDKIQKLFNEGINCEYEEISSEMKSSYLTYAHKYLGISATRKVFKEIKDLQPKFKQLYILMIAYEKRVSPRNEVLITKLYLEMCMNFGDIDVEMWIQCLRFTCSTKNYIQVKTVLDKASSILSPGLMIILKNEFEKIKTELGNDYDFTNQNVVDLHEDIEVIT